MVNLRFYETRLLNTQIRSGRIVEGLQHELKLRYSASVSSSTVVQSLGNANTYPLRITTISPKEKESGYGLSSGCQAHPRVRAFVLRFRISSARRLNRVRT